MAEPEIGSVATAELTVEERDLASVVGIDRTDVFPEVFATSRLVAVMEVAAARLLRPYLNDGEQSVG